MLLRSWRGVRITLLLRMSPRGVFTVTANADGSIDEPDETDIDSDAVSEGFREAAE